MRLVLLISLTMIAFAANSILNRVAVDSGEIDPGAFAVMRVLSGTAMLALLLRFQGKKMPVMHRERRMMGAAALALYMIGFSMAYTVLNAGLGALILFGVVQITMFVLSALSGGGPGRAQLIGASIAFGGLILILWPGEGASVDRSGVIFMTCAGIGWALYTLAGRGARDPLPVTAANFALAGPFVVLAGLMLGDLSAMTGYGALLVVISGAITSGMGYALWYSVLPRITAPTAAIVQLSVPVLAILGGALLLSEPVGMRFLIGAAIVLGGIALSLRPKGG